MNALIELTRRTQPEVTFTSPPIVFVGDGGAGKTTTAISATKHAIKEYRLDPSDVVVVANDTYNTAFGGKQFIVDQELFPAGVRVIRIVQCGCCESAPDMEREIRQAYSEKPFKMLFVEAVPGAEPSPLIMAFVQRFKVRPNIVGVVNADEAQPDKTFREHVISAADVLLVTRANKAPGVHEIRSVISAFRSPEDREGQLTMVASSEPNDISRSFFDSLAIPSKRESPQFAAVKHDMGEQFGLTVIVNPDLALQSNGGSGAGTAVRNLTTGKEQPLAELLSHHRRAKGYMRSVQGDHYYIDFTNDLSGGNLKVQRIAQPLSIHSDKPFLRFYNRGAPVDATRCVGLGIPFIDVALLGKYRYPDQVSFLKKNGEVATSWRADSLYAQGQPFVAAESSSGQFLEFKQNWTIVLDAWIKFRLDGVKTLLAHDPHLASSWSPRAAVELGMDITTAVVWYGNQQEQGDAWYASLLHRAPLKEYGTLAVAGTNAGGLGVAKLLFEGFGKLDALPKVLRDKTYSKITVDAESFGPSDPDMFFLASALMLAKEQGLSQRAFIVAVTNVIGLFKGVGHAIAAERWAELLSVGQEVFGEGE